ncbi:hypothetical protein [Lacisediminimonas sp.]|uniref:hypothetical protein n=1 Tax=Lacisediminimonas sp. TaxID=3060582 RepID=UPI002727F007|nr:hypothetical protein [Lacisediminimonas sp.]MDO8299704.1 hypothetical protein [Lacisediminimonas sp.]
MDKSTSAMKGTRSQRKIGAPEKKPSAPDGGLGCRVIYENKAKKKSGFLGAARAIFAKQSVSKQSARARLASIDLGPPAPKYVPSPPPRDAVAAGKSAHAGAAYDEGTAFAFLFEDAANKTQLGTDEGPPPPTYIPLPPSETPNMGFTQNDELDALAAQMDVQRQLARKSRQAAEESQPEMSSPSAGNESDEPGPTGTSITHTSIVNSSGDSEQPEFMKKELILTAPDRGILMMTGEESRLRILLTNMRTEPDGSKIEQAEMAYTDYQPPSVDIAGAADFFEQAAKQAGLNSEARPKR